MIPSKFHNAVQARLQQVRANNALRLLPAENNLIDFTSNDYLGLARSSQLAELVRKRSETECKSNGATGSRLLSGNSSRAEELEAELAGIFQGAASLILNSGYVANLAVLSTLPGRGDTIFFDESIHASIKDGLRLGLANRFSFRHNDLDHLESRLKKAKGRPWVVVESIYSMDGDRCPLRELASLIDKYEVASIVDEAHSTGVEGALGSGTVNLMKLQEQFPTRIYTFGKAMGHHGACVVGTRETVQSLINFARPFIYTTALPDHSLTTIKASFDFLAVKPGLQLQLSEAVQHFYKRLTAVGISSRCTGTQIQPLVIPGNSEVKAAAKAVQAAGFDVRPILSPTVKAGREQLRVSLHAFNSSSDIDGLVSSLNHFQKA